jgi:RNA polymerase sigma factor (sigma-70 family)
METTLNNAVNISEESRSSFALMVAKERHSLKGVAMQLTRDLDDSEDLVQETMLKAIRYQQHFQDGTNLKAWLYTIMKNSFINHYRRVKKRNTFLDSTDNTYFMDLPSQKSENEAYLNFMRKDMEKALNKLPHDIQVTLKKNMYGYKYCEIAEQLQIPIGTVKTRIFVARRMLRKTLKVYGDAFGLTAETA